MKKELMASVLTLTAGMATTLSFPQTALAKSVVIEKEFAKSFRLMAKNPVRYTADDGKVIVGRIYLSLEQTPFTPDYNNQLRGEMTGSFYFESDEYTSEYNGRQYKTIVSLTGDDGEVLLDRTHKSATGNTYQLYGCNSTQTSCTADTYELTIEADKKADLNLKFADELRLEILVEYGNGQSEWTKQTWQVPMVEVSK
ncbi:hypothetical protein QJS83_13430 [Bdellovibrio sp. 22V]|uniref:hypothetical protein n=1 Tax=Bdellovibrio TaxID=958 RepID=UPI002543799D|nr:hypothetical protein [Bdellovibrio sp. 22V]WII71465.1 hypothetical protein QJS83_13430 [Bdellovibrio sp. 22V]